MAQVERIERLARASGRLTTTPRRFSLPTLDCALMWILEAGIGAERQLAACTRICCPADQQHTHLGVVRWRADSLAVIQALDDGHCYLRADPPPIDDPPLAEIYRASGKLYLFRSKASCSPALSLEDAIHALADFVAGECVISRRQRTPLLGAIAADGAQWLTEMATG